MPLLARKSWSSAVVAPVNRCVDVYALDKAAASSVQLVVGVIGGVGSVVSERAKDP